MNVKLKNGCFWSKKQQNCTYKNSYDSQSWLLPDTPITTSQPKLQKNKLFLFCVVQGSYKNVYITIFEFPCTAGKMAVLAAKLIIRLKEVKLHI
jgi:hypothetical protein